MKITNNPHKVIIYLLALVAIVAILGTRIYGGPQQESKEEVMIDNTETIVLSLSNQAVNAFKNKEMKTLALMAHSDKGVRFSPYGFVDIEDDVVFTASQMMGAFDDDKKYVWGAFDGSGEDIQLTFGEYYEQFIYDEDFDNADDISYNEIIGMGNTINNISEAYPDGIFVEYHFRGFDPEFDGLDWKSLRLVFEQSGEDWLLVGVIHDQWTI